MPKISQRQRLLKSLESILLQQVYLQSSLQESTEEHTDICNRIKEILDLRLGILSSRTLLPRVRIPKTSANWELLFQLPSADFRQGTVVLFNINL